MNAVDMPWTDANLAPAQRFLALLWGELCGSSTLDSWQLRAMNLRSLLEEALDQLEVAKAFPPAARALTDVLAEARAVAQRDPIAKTYYSNVVALLDEPALRADPPDLQRTRQVAEMMLDLLAGYEGHLMEDLKSLLLSPNVKEKRKLASLASALATELSIRGYSRAYLETLQHEFASVGFATTLGKLFALLDAPDRPYTCIVPVNWPSFMLHARAGLASVTDSLPPLGDSKAEIEFKKLVAQVERFLVVDVKARDSHAAVAKVQIAAARILSLTALYAPNKNVEVPRQQILVRSGQETSLVGPDVWHEHYVRDVQDPASKIGRVPADLATTLAASLQYHYLGVLAKSPESRLTNFWIALETLFLESEGSIIEKITSTLPASLALDYLRRQLQALSIRVVAHSYRLHDTGASAEAAELRSLFGLGHKQKRISIRVDVLLDTLLDETRATTLLRLCARDSLLVFRLNRYREKVLSSSDLAESIEWHREVLRWQLRRIYRARNSLVHRGTLPKRASYLIQNLHTYLVMALNAIVAELGSSKQGLDTALARRGALYQLYLGQIKAKKLSRRGLLQPRAIWIPDGEPPIWSAT